MPIKNINNMVKLLPEIAPLIKTASLEQSFPTGSMNETLVSALELAYMEKMAHEVVDYDTLMRVNKAVSLYDLRDKVTALTNSMTKVASNVESEEDFLREYLSGIHVDFEKVASACVALHDSIGISDDLKVYAGAGHLNKESAVNALSWRASYTGDDNFTKIASFIQSTNTSKLTVEDNRSICGMVRMLDSKNGLHKCFEKEAFTVRRPDELINLGRRQVSYELLVSKADDIRRVMGQEIVDAIDAGPEAVEALDSAHKGLIGDLV
jgi:hypothetical protein